MSVTVTCVNDAPVADDETFSGAIGNTSLIVNDPDDGAPALSTPKKTISGDILAGDSDIDGPGPLTVTAGTFATADGGSVIIEADGDFTYHPAGDELHRHERLVQLHARGQRHARADRHGHGDDPDLGLRVVRQQQRGRQLGHLERAV